MKCNFLLLALFFCSFNVFAQKEKQHAQIFFSKGEVIESEINTNFEKKQTLRFSHNGKRKSTHIKKIDSMFTNGEVYHVKFIGLMYQWAKKIDQGQLNLYEANDKLILKIGSDFTDYYLLPKKKLGRTYSVLCLDSIAEDKKNMNREEFVVLVREFNQTVNSGYSKPVMFDSMRTSIKPLMMGFSIYRPEANLELKLTNRLSITNSFGMNFFGDTFRDAETFINSDYNAQLRFYHGYGRRLKRGKSVYNNFGSYISLNYTYLIENGTDNFGMVNLTWGHQEKSHFNSTFANSRLGFGIDPKSGGIYFVSLLNLGFTR